MINVPIAQGLRFRPINTDLFNFDNTPHSECRFIQYLPAAHYNIQVVSSSEVTPTITIIDSVIAVTGLGADVIGDLKYWTFVVPLDDLAANTFYRLKVWNGSTASFLSEYFQVAAQPTFFKLEWFNTENAFLLDYSNDHVNEMWIDGRMDELTHGGDISVYSNQGEDTILKSIVSRIFLFKCDVPDYLVEQLTLAMAHDNFYINEIQFVALKKPAVKQLGTSKIYSFSAELKQKTIIGINTHDVG